MRQASQQAVEDPQDHPAEEWAEWAEWTCKLRKRILHFFFFFLFFVHFYLKRHYSRRQLVVLYDRIEFNDSLRYAGVFLAEDVAHRVMDFDLHRRSEFKMHFISAYMVKGKYANLKKYYYLFFDVL